MGFDAPVKLTDVHDLTGFDCGEESINEYLAKTARKAQADKHAVAYVVCQLGTHKVVGFYTLSSGSVERSIVVPKSKQRNSPNQHSVTILGRMGVSIIAQGQGLAIDLLKDAVERCILASASIGSSAIVVHPLNERLEQFYAKYAGFIPCKSVSPVTMMLPII